MTYRPDLNDDTGLYDIRDENNRVVERGVSDINHPEVAKARCAELGRIESERLGNAENEVFVERIKASTLENLRLDGEGKERVGRLAAEPYTLKVLNPGRPADYAFVSDLFELIADFDPPAKLRQAAKAIKEQEAGYTEMLKHLSKAVDIYRNKIMMQAEIGGFEPAPADMIEQIERYIGQIKDRSRVHDFIGAEGVEVGDVGVSGTYNVAGDLARALNRLLELYHIMPENERYAFIAAWLRCCGHEKNSNWVRGVLKKGRT